MADPTNPTGNQAPSAYINSAGGLEQAPALSPAEAYMRGWAPASPQQIEEAKAQQEFHQKYGGASGELTAAAQRALSALSFGASDEALPWLAKHGIGSVTQEDLKSYAQENPKSAMAGTVAGIALPLLLTGGADAPAALGQAAKVTAPGVFAAAGRAATAETTQALAGLASSGKLGATIAKGLGSGMGLMTEGALWGAQNLISEHALGNADLNAQSIVANVGGGAVLGFGGGFAGDVGWNLAKDAFPIHKILGKAYTDQVQKWLAPDSVLKQEIKTHGADYVDELARDAHKAGLAGASAIASPEARAAAAQDFIANNAQKAAAIASNVDNTVADAEMINGQSFWMKQRFKVAGPLMDSAAPAIQAQGRRINRLLDSFGNKFAQMGATGLNQAKQELDAEIGKAYSQNPAVWSDYIQGVKAIRNSVNDTLRDFIATNGGEEMAQGFNQAVRNQEVGIFVRKGAQAYADAAPPKNFNPFYGAIGGAIGSALGVGTGGDAESGVEGGIAGAGLGAILGHGAMGAMVGGLARGALRPAIEAAGKRIQGVGVDVLGKMAGETGEMGPWAAKLAAAQARRQGGFTINVPTGENPTTGFAVAINKDFEKNLGQTITSNDIQAYTKAHAADLAQGANALGAWRSDTGEWYLDISKVMPDAKQAMAQGTANAQQAIFNLGTHESIPVNGMTMDDAAKILRGAAGDGTLKSVVNQTGQQVAAQRFADVANSQLGTAPNSVELHSQPLIHSPQQAAVLSEIERHKQEVAQAMDTGAGNIVRGSVQGHSDVSTGITNVGANAMSNHTNVMADIQRYANDPQAMLDRLSSLTKEWHEYAPETAAALQRMYVNAVTFLNSKLPQQDAPPMYGGEMPLSKQQVYEFGRYTEAIENPLTTLTRQATSGTLTPQHVEAVAAVYPQLLDSLRASVVEKMADAKQIPYRQRTMISMILGADVDGTRNPMNTLATQAMYQGPSERPMQSQQPQPGKPARNPKFNLADRTRTDVGQAASRGGEEV